VGCAGKKRGALVVAAVLISLSIGLRFNGIALAVAMGIVLLFQGGSWGRRGRFCSRSFGDLHGSLDDVAQGPHVSPADVSWVENSPNSRLDNVKYAIPLLHTMLPAVLSFLAGDVGIALLPAACAIFRRELLVRALTFFVIISAMCVMTHLKVGHYPLPLRNGETWALDELGATQPLVPGVQRIQCARCRCTGERRCLDGHHWRSCSRHCGAGRRRWNGFFIASMLLTVLVMALLWLLYDRYALPIVVLLLVLVLARQRGLRMWRARAGPGDLRSRLARRDARSPQVQRCALGRRASAARAGRERMRKLSADTRSTAGCNTRIRKNAPKDESEW
jgi:hypothetical protein